MKKWSKILPAAAMIFLLAGCGKTTVEMTTIAIQKDGTIEHTLVEDFTDGSVGALESMLSEKAAAYNSSNPGEGEGIVVNTVEAQEGVVRVVMTYPDAVSFDGFMNMDVVEVDPALRAPFFYDTVEDAFMQGFDLDITMKGAENDKVLQGKDDILLMGKNKLIIYDNEMNLGSPVQISTQDKPLYISDNVKVAGKNLLEISETDELAYILLQG